MLRSLGRISRQSAVIDAALRRAASTVAVGDAIPPGIELDAGFPPAKFDLADRLAEGGDPVSHCSANKVPNPTLTLTLTLT